MTLRQFFAGRTPVPDDPAMGEKGRERLAAALERARSRHGDGGDPGAGSPHRGEPFAPSPRLDPPARPSGLRSGPVAAANAAAPPRPPRQPKPTTRYPQKASAVAGGAGPRIEDTPGPAPASPGAPGSGFASLGGGARSAPALPGAMDPDGHPPGPPATQGPPAADRGAPMPVGLAPFARSNASAQPSDETRGPQPLRLGADDHVGGAAAPPVPRPMSASRPVSAPRPMSAPVAPAAALNAARPPPAPEAAPAVERTAPVALSRIQSADAEPREAPFAETGAVRPARLLPWSLLPLAALAGLLALWLTPGGLAPSAPRLAGAFAGWAMATGAGLAAGLTLFLPVAGLAHLYRRTGVVGFAQGALAGLGGLAALAVAAEMAGSAGTGLPETVLLALAAAALLPAFLALGLAMALLRPLRRNPLAATAMMLAIMAGLAAIRPGLAPGIAMPSLPWPDAGGPPGLGLPLLLAGGIGLAVAGLILLGGRPRREPPRSRHRLERPPRAPGLVAATGLAALLAGLGGGLWALQGGDTGQGAGMALLLPVLLAAAMGGLGSREGALLASLLLGLTQAYGSAIGGEAGRWAPVALTCAVLLLRPRGLLGQRVPSADAAE